MTLDGEHIAMLLRSRTVALHRLLDGQRPSIRQRAFQMPPDLVGRAPTSRSGLDKRAQRAREDHALALTSLSSFRQEGSCRLTLFDSLAMPNGMMKVVPVVGVTVTRQTTRTKLCDVRALGRVELGLDLLVEPLSVGQLREVAIGLLLLTALTAALSLSRRDTSAQ